MPTRYVGLSGSGSQAPSGGIPNGFVHVTVTNLGNAKTSDIGGKLRYILIGWIAFYEHNPGNAAPDTGDYLCPPHYIDFDHDVWHDQTVTDIAGADGFYYHFYPGVVANVVVE